MNQHRYTLEELPKTFIGTGEVKGFSFTQIKQNEFAYIYQVNVEGKLHFEVFKKKSTPICIDFMNRIYS